MATTTRRTYEQRLEEFAGGRLFHEVEAGVTHDANGQRCQACGSAAPKRLRLIEDMSGNQYLVGVDCCLALRTVVNDKCWTDFKSAGRPFELWLEANKHRFGHKPLFMLFELFMQDSEDKAG